MIMPETTTEAIATAERIQQLRARAHHDAERDQIANAVAKAQPATDHDVRNGNQGSSLAERMSTSRLTRPEANQATSDDKAIAAAAVNNEIRRMLVIKD